MMKTNMMRAPLIKSAIVLLVFVLLAYLTSASPGGGVLNSLGLIIIGAFRFVQWLIAMAIGLAVCIGFLIGIFLFAVSLVNKETAASMYAATKVSIAELCRPIFAAIASLQCKESQCCAPAAAPSAELKDELQAIISSAVQKVADNQQALNTQFAAITSKLEALETKSADFAAAAQLDAIAGDIAASGQALNEVKTNVAALEGKLNDTAAKLQGLNPEQILGDLPARLEKLEQQEDSFDPQPLTASVAALHKEVEEMKKKGSSPKPKKKA